MPLDLKTVEMMREVWSGYPPCCICGGPSSRIHQSRYYCHPCRLRADKPLRVEITTSGHPVSRYGRRM